MRCSRRDFLIRSAAAGPAVCWIGCLPLRARQDGRLAGTYDVGIDGDADTDLHFLEPLLEDVRIVQLGENGHCAGEAMRVRARIAEYLVERLGFEVLAFESSLFLAYLADRRLGETDAQRTLTSSLIGVWHTREMLRLFEMLRARRAAGNDVHLAAFDVQPIGGNRKQRPAFFADLAEQVDGEAAKRALALDSDFLDIYGKPSGERRALLRARGAELAAGYDWLADLFQRHHSQFKDRTVALVARQEARSAAAYVRFQAASEMSRYAEIRDHGMFENLKFLAEELYPKKKIVVWGHNYHLRHDNAAIPASKEIFPGVPARSMGHWAKAHFGRWLYTVGQYERTGTAADNARKEYAIDPPAPGTLEARLRPEPGKALFIDLRQAAAGQGGDWLRQPVMARYNAQHPETIVPAAQYDALLVLDSVKPPAFLY